MREPLYVFRFIKIIPAKIDVLQVGKVPKLERYISSEISITKVKVY